MWPPPKPEPKREQPCKPRDDTPKTPYPFNPPPTALSRLELVAIGAPGAQSFIRNPEY